MLPSRLAPFLAILALTGGCFGGPKKSPEADPRLAGKSTIGVLCFRDRGTRVAEEAQPWIEVVSRVTLRDAGFDSKGLSGIAGAPDAIQSFRSAGIGNANALPVESAREKLAAAVQAVAAGGGVDAVLFVREMPFAGVPVMAFEIGVIDASGDVLLGGSANTSAGIKPEDALRKALEKLPRKAATP